MNPILSFLAFSAMSMSLYAQSLTAATADQLAQRLAPAQALTRGLTRNLAPKAQSVDLVVQFDFDSAQLQEDSKPLLDNLAEAMQRDRLKSLKFKVEGHTDAKGTAEYNQQLSGRRATSVVNYLQSKGIDSERLIPEGRGFSDLLLPDKPQAMENRRVRVLAMP
jgi:outer membrane protein OmpA-like peptidoglycan-associated protein